MDVRLRFFCPTLSTGPVAWGESRVCHCEPAFDGSYTVFATHDISGYRRREIGDLMS